MSSTFTGKIFAALFLIGIIPFTLHAQTYNIATYNGQTVNTCSGTFVDAGGAGAYSNNEDYTVTFCSSSGLPLKFDFSTAGSFDIDVPNDTLFFYDGVAATGTPIAILTYLDDNTQTTYSSQLAINTLSTCVTVRWKSNASGTDNGWSAVISCGAPPTCANNPPAADIFGQATPICNTLNYCGTTSSYYKEDTPFNLIGGGVCPVPDDGIFGATIENNSWLKFEALATSAVFNFTVSGGSCSSGIQAGVFSFNTTTSTFALKSPCALTDAGQLGSFTLTASSLTPGEVYYLMIDGYAGDNCDYNIGVNTGVAVVEAGPNQAVCDTFVTLAANSPMTVGVWSVASGTGDFADNTNPNTYVSGLSSGNNEFVWTSTSTFCGAISDTVTINVTASVPINVTCGTSTTNSVQFNWNAASGATGYDITYTINGGSPTNDNTTAITYSIGSLNPGDNVSISVTPTGGSCYTTETISCSANLASCTANAGTVTVLINSVDVTNVSNEYVLCYNDVLQINTDANYTLPPAAGADPAGLGYGFYTAAPVGTDPALDAGFSGLIDYHENTSDINVDGPSSPVFSALGTSNPFFWIVPFTLDDKLNLAAGGANDSRGWDVNSDDCYQLGTPMKFTYVNAIAASATEDCSNGTATITISGGSPELIAGAEYHIDATGSGTLSDTLLSISGGTVILSGLSGGDNYTVTITDNNGCSYILNGGPFVATPVVSATPTNLNCFGDASGSIDLTVTGGTGSITYEWSHDPLETAQDISGLDAGTYYFTVTDAIGCADSDSITISEPAVLTINSSGTDLACFNDHSGTAQIVASGGTSPYSYLWSNSSTTSNISGLDAGTYLFTVTDSNGCDSGGAVILGEPLAIQIAETLIDAYCPESNNGSIEIVVSGGTQPYSYLWTDGSTTALVGNIGAGNYTVTITDQNSCSEIRVFTIGSENTQCLNIPTAYSPNGDGVNDNWEIEGIENFGPIKIQIYNRWGQMVFEFNGTGAEYADPDNRWKGQYNDTDLMSNSFVFVLDLLNGNEPYSGIVTLIKK